MWLRIAKEGDLPSDITPHVLRLSFASYHEPTIAGLLGHTVPGVTARYAHVPDSALLAAADRVSAQIAAALYGFGAETKVVQLREAPKRGVVETTLE